MIRIVLILFALGSLVFSATANASVQCTCPTVDAEGEGNTSCSVSESDGFCTIDFNLFTEDRELRAVDIIREVTNRNYEDLVYKYSHLSAVNAMRELPTEEIPNIVRIYLMVAFAGQLERRPETIRFSSVEKIMSFVDGNADNIMNAFASQIVIPFDVSNEELLKNYDAPSRSGNTIISPGCIEVNTDDAWVMFKASWSPSRAFPGCGAE